MGHQGGPEPDPLRSRKLLLAEAGRGTGGKPGPAARQAPPGRQELPPLWHRPLETAVQTLEPPGRHGDWQRACSSGSDRERQWRLLGGAEGGPELSLRSPALTAPRPMLTRQGPGEKGSVGTAVAWLLLGSPPLGAFRGHLSSEEKGRRDTGEQEAPAILRVELLCHPTYSRGLVALRGRCCGTLEPPPWAHTWSGPAPAAFPGQLGPGATSPPPRTQRGQHGRCRGPCQEPEGL